MYVVLPCIRICICRYSDEFSGLTLAVLIFCGLLGAAGISIFVDKTKLYLETIKVSYSIALVCFVVFSFFLLFPNMQVFILVILVFFGITCFALYPLFLELGVECTFPDVSEVTSNTLLLMGGQLFAILFIFLVPLTTSPLSPAELPLNVCDTNPLEYKYYVTTLTVMLSAAVVLTILALHTEYRRLAYDRAQEGLGRAGRPLPLPTGPHAHGVLPINADSPTPGFPVI